MGRIAKVTDKLSDEGQRVLAQGFANARPAAAIAEALLTTTGEVVAERTIARRASEWRARRLAFDEAQQKMAAMKAAGFDGSELIQALALERLQEEGLGYGSDPLKVQRLALAAEELRVKKAQLAVKERGIAAVERRLALLEEREKRAVDALRKDTAEMTPEQRLEEIRSIYGLRTGGANAAA